MIFLGKEIRNYGEPFIVAEISGNHNGRFNRAIQLLGIAKDVGADAVKLQCFTPDDLTLDNGYVIGGGTPWSDQSLYELYSKCYTPLDWIEPLFEHGKLIGIPVFSSVYNERGLKFLENLNCPAYKIASYEANDLNLIEKVAGTSKPFVVSLGTIGQEELNRILVTISGEQTDNLVLLHCVAKYPLEFDELGLQDMTNLQNILTNSNYSVPVGFSCHCNDPAAVILAAGLGAAMIEVHLTVGDEEDGETEDFEFSFTPEHLRYAIDRAKKSKQSVSVKNHTLETAAREFKRSLFVVKDINKGEVFTREHIAALRPNIGEPPYFLHQILGKKAAKNVTKGSPMRMEYVE